MSRPCPSPRLLAAILAVAGTLASGCSTDAGGQQGLPMVELRIGSKTVQAEVASTSAQRKAGLMHRRRLGTDSGMLFVFANRTRHVFHMQNTVIPLSIGFLVAEPPADGRVRYRLDSVIEMQPCTTGAVCPQYSSGKASDAALEMNAGWFSRSKIELGTIVEVLGTLPSPAQ